MPQSHEGSSFPFYRSSGGGMAFLWPDPTGFDFLQCYYFVIMKTIPFLDPEIWDHWQWEQDKEVDSEK